MGCAWSLGFLMGYYTFVARDDICYADREISFDDAEFAMCIVFFHKVSCEEPA